MLDWTEHLRGVAQHLIWMSNVPGAQEHAKLRRDEMLADPMYAGLREEIVRQLQEAKAHSST
jgi:hypothetical protein